MKGFLWIPPGLLAVSYLLTSCVSAQQQPERYLSLYGVVPVQSNRFLICNQVGCEETVTIRLSDDSWNVIQTLFQPQAADGQSERLQIAAAIARLEQLVAGQAGTFDDQPRNRGTFRGTRQLDCVAETTNTTIYLLLLADAGLLRWHSVGYPKHRGLFNLQFPHNTAVLIERDSQQLFAVDSYFHGNGQPPEIVPLATWVDGYDPGS